MRHRPPASSQRISVPQRPAPTGLQGFPRPGAARTALLDIIEGRGRIRQTAGERATARARRSREHSRQWAQEILRVDFERTSQSTQNCDAHGHVRALDRSDISRAETGTMCQLFLRQLPFVANTTQICSHDLIEIHGSKKSDRNDHSRNDRSYSKLGMLLCRENEIRFPQKIELMGQPSMDNEELDKWRRGASAAEAAITAARRSRDWEPLDFLAAAMGIGDDPEDRGAWEAICEELCRPGILSRCPPR